MRNPLESEEAAFRFVLGTIVYFVPIVIAAWIATWLGVIVFVAMSALAVVLLRRGTTAAPPVVSTERAAVEDTYRLLVVTDVTLLGPRLREAILRLVAGVEEDVLLICALAAPPAPQGVDGTPAPTEPPELETALQGLHAAGVNARGAIAAGGPLDALEEALRGFDADEVVISITAGPGVPTAVAPAASAEDVGAALRPHFAGPVTVVTEDG